MQITIVKDRPDHPVQEESQDFLVKKDQLAIEERFGTGMKRGKTSNN